MAEHDTRGPSWLMQLASAIRTAGDGDRFIVPSDAGITLGRRVARKTCPELSLSFIVRPDESAKRILH